MATTLENLNDNQRQDLVEDLNDMLQLDHDAIEAYDETINRLDNQEWANQVATFRGDHERHVRDLTPLIERLGGTPKQKPHATGPFKKAMVTLGDVGGDTGVLKSFRTNEAQVKNKYDKYAGKDYPAEVSEVVRRNAQDEHRHYAWVDSVLKETGND